MEPTEDIVLLFTLQIPTFIVLTVAFCFIISMFIEDLKREYCHESKLGKALTYLFVITAVIAYLIGSILFALKVIMIILDFFC